MNQQLSTIQNQSSQTESRKTDPRCASAGGNRKGYAGYECDPVTPYLLWHVRNRVLNCIAGHWLSRDTTYSDGMSLYAITQANPLMFRDPRGRVGMRITSDLLSLDPCPAAGAIAHFQPAVWATDQAEVGQEGIFVNRVYWEEESNICNFPRARKSIGWYETVFDDAGELITVRLPNMGFRVFGPLDESKIHYISRAYRSHGSIKTHGEVRWVPLDALTPGHFKDDPREWTVPPLSTESPLDIRWPALVSPQSPSWFPWARPVGDASNTHTLDWDCCCAASAERASTTISPSVKTADGDWSSIQWTPNGFQPRQELRSADE